MGRRIIFSFILLFALICSTFFDGNYVFAENSVVNTPCGTVTYSYSAIGDGNYLVSYKGTDKNLKLPVITSHGNITTVGESAFLGNTAITDLTIPDEYKCISNAAFQDCTNLTCVFECGGITEIRESAFKNCSTLSSFCFGDMLENIGDYAFSNTALRRVTFPKGIKYINSGAFAGCNSVTEINLPKDCRVRIGDYAFFNCTALKSVVIGAEITHIGDFSFGFYKTDSGKIEKTDGFTIYGLHNTAAHQYAKDYGFNFVNISISDATVQNVKTKVYGNKAQTQSLTVKSGKVTLLKNHDYRLSYKNNKSVGTATVTVTGIGKFTGKKTVKFKIIPQSAKPLYVSGGKKRIYVKWQKVSNVTGYKIEISRYKNFKSFKTVTVKGAAKTFKTVTNLAAGKKYYVRIRTYKYLNKSQTLHGYRSAVLSVHTK